MSIKIMRLLAISTTALVILSLIFLLSKVRLSRSEDSPILYGRSHQNAIALKARQISSEIQKARWPAMNKPYTERDLANAYIYVNIAPGEPMPSIQVPGQNVRSISATWYALSSPDALSQVYVYYLTLEKERTLEWPASLSSIMQVGAKCQTVVLHFDPYLGATNMKLPIYSNNWAHHYDAFMQQGTKSETILSHDKLEWLKMTKPAPSHSLGLTSIGWVPAPLYYRIDCNKDDSLLQSVVAVWRSTDVPTHHVEATLQYQDGTQKKIQLPLQTNLNL